MNLKKILAGVAAGAMAATSLVMPTSAAAATTGTVAVNIGDNGAIISLDYSDWHDYAALIITVTPVAMELEEGDWAGANGIVGYNDASGSWNQSTTWSADTADAIVIDLVNDVNRYEPVKGETNENAIQVQVWWAGSADDVKYAGLTLCEISYELYGTYEADDTTTGGNTATGGDDTTGGDDNTAKPVEIELGGKGKLTNEGGGVRLTVYNPWGDDDMKLIDWADVEGTQTISVKFQVTGMETRDVHIAYLTISNFDNINYWGPDDNSNSNVTQIPVTIAGDGVYVVTAELDVPYALGENNFLAVQTDIPVDEDDEELENVPQLSLVAVAIDAPLTVAEGELPSDVVDPDAQTPGDSTPDVTPDDNNGGDTNPPADDNGGDTNPPADDNNTPATDNGVNNGTTNPPTGVILLAVPAIAAAAGVVIAKKRK